MEKFTGKSEIFHIQNHYSVMKVCIIYSKLKVVVNNIIERDFFMKNVKKNIARILMASMMAGYCFMNIRRASIIMSCTVS